MLKETKLGRMVLLAAGIDPDSDRSRAVTQYRIPGKAGAGRFACVLHEVVFLDHCHGRPEGLTIARVNELLDALVASAGAGVLV